jgi:hypothetical protein
MNRVAQLLCLAWAVSGCAGELDNPDDFTFLLDGSAADASGSDDDAGGTGELPECVAEAFDTGCGTSACHGVGSLTVDLLSPGVAERLVDMPAIDDGLCKDRVYIPTDGEPSLLLQKLSDAVDCGLLMPYGRLGTTPWDEDSYDCVEAWVTSLGGSALEASP